ncbi:MAG: hypothetical protein HYT16_03125 [DPANN group archaeon]|nr:hypothetical protein [DPANN group archaeon]
MATEEIFNKIISRQLKLAGEIDKIATSANLLRSSLTHVVSLGERVRARKKENDELREAYRKMAGEKGVTTNALRAQAVRISQAGEYENNAHKDAHDMLKRFEGHFKAIEDGLRNMRKLFR